VLSAERCEKGGQGEDGGVKYSSIKVLTVLKRAARGPWDLEHK
jgi:hypothetical protein